MDYVMICIKLKLFTIVTFLTEYTLNVHGYMLMCEQKSAIFTQQTEINFLSPSQLITTLNNYACSSPPLANINWSAIPECFLLTM